MKYIRKIFKKTNRSRGQGLVEYGLLLIITLLAAGVILSTQKAAEEAVGGSIASSSSQNPKADNIALPDPVSGEEIWDKTPPDRGGEGLNLKPVAYFTIANPVYIGQPVTYWDNSYDPDGQIVERIWSGKVEVFNKAGEYKIKLTVKDDSDLTDSYEVTVKVTERSTYKELIYDHSKETRTLLEETDVYEVGSSVTRILDHIYGESVDLYNVKHPVIQMNYWETVLQKAKDITYEVKIPIMEVTYNGRGQEISRVPYKVDGVPQYIIQEDMRTVPEPAEIDVEWKENNWTYYVYDRVSSVNNSTGSWGQRSPSVDHPRFAPETKVTTQNPAWVSSRNSTKDNKYNAGYNATSTPCKTCTIPNEISPKSTNQTDTRSVSCQVGSASKVTHSRTYNYIDHKASDIAYKYTGTGLNAGTSKEEKIQRHTWKTEGWKSDEMVGTSGYAAKPKYTNCDGDGWSENCWKPLPNSQNFNLSWELYDTKSGTNTQTISRQEYKEVCKIVNKVNKCAYEWVNVPVKQERSYTTYYYKRQEWTCNWSGTNVTSQNFTWGYDSNTNYGSWYDA